jgi:DHA1 family tetracycline resistance protein-like MFS transporter
MLGMPISCLQGLLVPGLQGIMTSRVPANEQGQLQGANQSLGGIASVIGPSVFGLTFAWAVRHPDLHVPGLAMELAAMAMVVCTLLGIQAHRRAASA